MTVQGPVYCNISGCSPKAQWALGCMARDEDRVPSLKVIKALNLLGSPDECKGSEALTVIGLFDGRNDSEREDRPRTLEEALAVPKERVLVTHGCAAGPKLINVSKGTTFFVVTIMLPILDAATGGRVTPYRLWRLALSRGRFRGNFHGAIKGVDYGPILEHYSGSDPQLFGKLGYGYVPALEETGTPEDIAELLRAAGYWMWMRPDRFPINIPHSTHARSTPVALTVSITGSDSSRAPISQLPIELLLSICSDLPLPDIITLATSSKVLYVPLLGTLGSKRAMP